MTKVPHDQSGIGLHAILRTIEQEGRAALGRLAATVNPAGIPLVRHHRAAKRRTTDQVRK